MPQPSKELHGLDNGWESKQIEPQTNGRHTDRLGQVPADARYMPSQLHDGGYFSILDAEHTQSPRAGHRHKIGHAATVAAG